MSYNPYYNRPYRAYRPYPYRPYARRPYYPRAVAAPPPPRISGSGAYKVRVKRSTVKPRVKSAPAAASTYTDVPNTTSYRSQGGSVGRDIGRALGSVYGLVRNIFGSGDYTTGEAPAMNSLFKGSSNFATDGTAFSFGDKSVGFVDTLLYQLRYKKTPFRRGR